MSIFDLLLLALALCIDSFIASVTTGLQKNNTLKTGLLCASLCAFFQGLLPLLGIIVGGLFKDSFDKYDHWIAFALLLLIGVKMFFEAFKKEEEHISSKKSKISVLIALAIATSIDAFVVGVGLGFELITFSSKIFAISIFTVSTFIMAFIGFLLGRKQKFIPAKFATVLGGIVLIALGAKILIEHNAISLC